MLNQTTAYGGKHRIIITCDTAMDELLLRVEVNELTWAKGQCTIEAFRTEVSQRIQNLLGLRTEVEIMPEDQLSRTDFKARRVVDHREAFREMHRRLSTASKP